MRSNWVDFHGQGGGSVIGTTAQDSRHRAEFFKEGLAGHKLTLFG